MADATGVIAASVMNDLLERGHEFSFVQVMRMARRFLDPRGEEGLPEVPWQDRVLVRPELSLAFPASDVTRVERDGDKLRVTATFLGLYGSSSPLPNFYTEDLFDEASSDESVIRDFLDIIHQRLYHLYFQCWSKYRLFIRVAEENNPIDRERLYCLIGLGEKELRNTVPDSWSLLRYAGLFTQNPRSALGLKTLLREVFSLKSIRITQNVQRLVPIPADQRLSMGSSCCRLGVDAVLGSEIADQMGKFRIEIGPLSWEGFNGLVPGTSQHEKLARLVKFYLLDPLAVDLKLILAAGEARPLRLGDPAARLGLNTWCFAGETLGELSTVFPLAATPVNNSTESDSSCSSPPASSRSLIDYYQKVRAQLGELTARFAEAHPNLASMVSGSMADPGVEKLLEGTAFYHALLQWKLADDFPEFIHEVIHSLQPEQLRPIPASTIVAFTPKPNCTETQVIPAGTQIDSVPVDGTSCRFTTSYPVEIHPLTLIDASFAHPSGRSAALTLSLELKQISLQDWAPKSLRFFLAGEYAHASNLYLLMTCHLCRIVISSGDEQSQVVLDPSYLKPFGFDNKDALFHSHCQSDYTDQVVRDFSILPVKFLFLDLQGWEKWQGRGEGSRFRLSFEFDKLPFQPHKVTADDFVLFAAPAVNLFSQEALPIVLHETENEYPILPVGGNPERYQVYSVEKVAGILRGTAQKQPFTYRFSNSKLDSGYLYQITRRAALVHQGLDTFISVKTPLKHHANEIAKLAITILCTNGSLPENLGIGEICKQTRNSPTFATFANCIPVTNAMSDAFENNRLWKLFSLKCANLKLLTTESLCAVLKLICTSITRNLTMAVRSENCIAGIEDVKIEPCGRIIRGALRQGWDVRIKLDRDLFLSHGDMYLFGGVLDHFLRGFVSESYFSRTFVEDVKNNVVYEWSEQMGRRSNI